MGQMNMLQQRSGYFKNNMSFKWKHWQSRCNCGKGGRAWLVWVYSQSGYFFLLFLFYYLFDMQGGPEGTSDPALVCSCLSCGPKQHCGVCVL